MGNHWLHGLISNKGCKVSAKVCILLSNGLCQYSSSCSLRFFLFSFFYSSFVNSSSRSSFSDNSWDRLLLCGVGISSSISLAKLATSTIIVLGISIMASFNFFFNLSLKVSFKYISSCYYGITVHNYKNLS